MELIEHPILKDARLFFEKLETISWSVRRPSDMRWESHNSELFLSFGDSHSHVELSFYGHGKYCYWAYKNGSVRSGSQSISELPCDDILSMICTR